MAADFRRSPAQSIPLTMCDSPVNRGESFRFLGTIIAKDLRWAENITSTIKKAQQRMFFLRQLKKFNMPQKVMVELDTDHHSVSREGHRLQPAGSPRPVPLQGQQESRQDHC